MPRVPRTFEVEEVFHIFNRGVRNTTLFREEKNYQRFLERLRAYAILDGVAVLAYALLPSHFHLLLRQLTEKPLSAFLRRLQTSYARYVNVKYTETGHLFEHRFEDRHVGDDSYFQHLTRYINLNPVQHVRDIRRAVGRARSYPWSSCGFFLGERDDTIVDQKILRSLVPRDFLGKGYERFLLRGPWPPPKDIDALAPRREISRSDP